MENEIVKETYHQMTIDEWVEIKNELQRELQNVAESFVRIGYQLRKIRDGKLYEQDGYKTISEFAQKEYGLSPSITSRFMAINEKYSVDGNSKYLKPEYSGYGQSKLTEMLGLPESDMDMVSPDMQRSDIRELKDFNKTEPEEGIADDRYQLFEEFYKANPEIVKALYGSRRTCADPEEMKEIFIPSGNRVYRKGLFFVSFTETDTKIKRFGGTPESMSWEELRDMTEAIFSWDAEGEKTYDNHFGVKEEAGDNKEEEKADDTEGIAGDAGSGQGSGDKEEGRHGGDAAEAGGNAGTAGGDPGADSSHKGEDGTDEEPEGDGGAAGQEPADGFAPAQMEAQKEGESEELAGAMNPPEVPGNQSEMPKNQSEMPKDAQKALKDVENEEEPEYPEEPEEAAGQEDAIKEFESLCYEISKKITEIRKLTDQKKLGTAYIEATHLVDLIKTARQMQEA